jgi:transcriptional regulator with XRE-family HTH domain
MEMGKSTIKERESFVIFRRRNKITLTDVAKAIKISIGTISRYEANKRDLTPEILEAYREFKKNYKKC